ncbi:MAG TPA: TlpA disulfide reductase family protein [Symbiobacteriaceae bacterium]|jgi:cytochrome c biogenesis protein CcmG, thiol:disulfide interchange protein DsbE|nr:TlpA disulfide reductase family protein [Symbiobacteriaceae bacterium]
MRRSLLALALAGVMAAGCAGAQQAAEQPPAENKPAAAAPQSPSQQAPAAAKKPAPLKGYPAPEITGKDVRSGKMLSLSQLKGKVVLVNFWATWCPPCRQEMPDLQTLQTELGDQVHVLAVGGDPGEGPDKLLGFAEDQELGFTVLFDGGQSIREYRAVALPTTFAVDANGIIREKVQGPMTLEQMREVVAKTQAAEEKGP